MQRAFSNFKELLSEFYQICKDFFYDSYSGWKIKRIAIAAGSTLSVVALLIAFIVVVPNGPLGKMVSDGLSDVADALLPEDVADGLKVILGSGEQGVFKYPDIQAGQTVPSDIGKSSIIPKNLDKDTHGVWVWKGRKEPPVLGDILSTDGTKSEPEDVPMKEDPELQAVLPAQSTYSWTTLSELQGKTYRKVEGVQNKLLLRIVKAIENNEVYSYSVDVRKALSDITVLGKEVRENLSPQVVEVWERLEPLYIQFYSDVYACENSAELNEVATSDNYALAVQMTAEFLSVLQQERAAE